MSGNGVIHRFAYQQLSPVLMRRVGWFGPDGAYFTHAHWCPACNEFHDFAVEQPFSNGARWTFDGDVAAPTMTPSMNIRIGPFKDGTMNVCHYYLTCGRILFLGDCTHELKGQTVDLPVLPAEKMISWEKL
jgi:hypothetical protein